MGISTGHKSDAGAIEDLVGKIDPREPDVIQQLRRKVRVTGLKLGAERAYVKQVRRSMAACGLRELADFAVVGSSEIEGFLTDLAADGDVAPSIQNQAFYALKYLFEQVLQREVGNIDSPHYFSWQ